MDAFAILAPAKRALAALLLLAVAFGVGTVPATADPILLFDTFGPGNSYDTGGRYGVDGNAVFQAFRFLPTESALLATITVALGRTTTGTTATRFELYEGTPTTLGLLLELFDVPNMVAPGETPGAIVTFSSVLHPSLNAGQDYWLSYKEPDLANGSTSLWFFNDQGIFGTRLTSVLPPASNIMPAFRVEGVPEPATGFLLVASLLWVLCSRPGRKVCDGAEGRGGAT